MRFIKDLGYYRVMRACLVSVILLVVLCCMRQWWTHISNGHLPMPTEVISSVLINIVNAVLLLVVWTVVVVGLLERQQWDEPWHYQIAASLYALLILIAMLRYGVVDLGFGWMIDLAISATIGWCYHAILFNPQFLLYGAVDDDDDESATPYQ